MKKSERIIKKYNKRNFDVYRKSFSCYFDPFYDLIRWKGRIAVIHGLIDKKKYPRYCITSEDFKLIDGYGYFNHNWYYFNIMGGESTNNDCDNNGLYCDIEQMTYKSYKYLRYSFIVFTNKYPLEAFELANVLSRIENWIGFDSWNYSFYSSVFRDSCEYRVVIENNDIL
jgi:hypothetical protein